MLNKIKKLIGLTRTETSILGKWALSTFAKKEIKRALGFGLVLLYVGAILTKSMANIGGSIAFAMEPTLAKELIDTTTISTVQSPVPFTYESRGLSWFHSGADLVVDTGTPIYPIMVGEIVATNYENWGYGIHVIVKHDGGYESLYGHMSKIDVKVGQKVDLKTELGKSGSTGFSTGPHVHLEIHQNGQLVNPADIVPGVK